MSQTSDGTADTADDMQEDDMSIIARQLKFEFYNKDEIVFNVGDKGDKFYIIMQGEASVLVPIKKSFKEGGSI